MFLSKCIAINELTSRPAGLEPATYGLEIRCSVHLSYGRKSLSFWELITFYKKNAFPTNLRPLYIQPVNIARRLKVSFAAGAKSKDIAIAVKNKGKGGKKKFATDRAY